MISHAPKSTKSIKKHQKAQKAPKSTKSTKTHKNANKQKHKNTNKRTKIKNAVKKHLSGKKSYLFAYLHFCVFCALEEKKMESPIIEIC